MKQTITYAIIVGLFVLPFFFYKWLLGRKKRPEGVNNTYAMFLSVITGIIIISVSLFILVHTGKK